VEEDVQPGSLRHLNSRFRESIHEAGENVDKGYDHPGAYFSQRVELAFVAV
jgi:hypothetical protein